MRSHKSGRDPFDFRLKPAIQHRLNPLHIYCRLVPIVGRSKALAFASKYENIYKKVSVPPSTP